ncbi:MAG: nicotinate (nicotinamide) nucleotide adenylyltransferase [Verrucomicrobia bacterium]|nr:nicotinate (nicotinamide) nucleotide adenylyltransferase [Verrucomicrobiota bacterium]MBS0645084.1 nicotinate (nicotinamide) nucleotide adenylyltransferase [Verrucomicrobiota bacterium]
MEDSLIGLFGGSFNPVHFGHLNLAIYLKETYQLSEVWWIPAHASPFRLHEPMVSPQHRFKMVELALEGLEDFKVLDLEVCRPPPSYTIDTIRQLQSMYPNKKFALLCSEDVLEYLDSWKEAEELKKRVRILVGAREKQRDSCPIMQISSTQIRKRLEKGLYCGHLVPSKVLDYISENHLYFVS